MQSSTLWELHVIIVMMYTTLAIVVMASIPYKYGRFKKTEKEIQQEEEKAKKKAQKKAIAKRKNVRRKSERFKDMLLLKPEEKITNEDIENEIDSWQICKELKQHHNSVALTSQKTSIGSKRGLVNLLEVPPTENKKPLLGGRLTPRAARISLIPVIEEIKEEELENDNDDMISSLSFRSDI